MVDLVTALLTYRLSKTSVNIRAALLHNLADALGSVAVIIAGTLVLLFDWQLVDPIVTILIAGYILWQSFTEIGPVIRILMLGSPPNIATGDALETVQAVNGVLDVHHAHCWQMQEHQVALDAHVVIEAGRWHEADAIKARVKSTLREHFGIVHTTIEMVCAQHECSNIRQIGCDGPTDEH